MSARSERQKPLFAYFRESEPDRETTFNAKSVPAVFCSFLRRETALAALICFCERRQGAHVTNVVWILARRLGQTLCVST